MADQPHQTQHADRRASERVALLFFNGTFVFQENGAHARTAELLDFLVSTFERVVVYSFRNHPTCPWTPAAERQFRRRYPRVQLVLEHQGRALRALSRCRNAMLQLLPEHSRATMNWSFDSLAPEYQHMLTTIESRCVMFVSYVDGISQIPSLPERACIVVETHDLKFLSYAKTQGDSATSVRTLAKLRGELAAVSLADAVVAISPFEAQLYAALSPATRIFYIPKYIAHSRDLASFEPAELKYQFLFVASENQLNVEGFVKFLSDQKGLIAGHSVALCGRVCNERRIVDACAERAGIELLGYIPDLAEIHARSRVCLAPVEGTGLKIKILDALRYGRPVLATASAMAGLPAGYEDCVFPLVSSDAERLVHDDEFWTRAARAAQRYSRRLMEMGELSALQDFVSS